MHPRRRPPRLRGVIAIALGSVLVSACSIASVPGPFMGLVPTPGEGADAVGGRQAEPTVRRETRAQAAAERAAQRPFTMDLAGPNDHVPQYDGSWCVGASMQMMINMIEPGPPDRTRRTQQTLYRFARQTSPWIETRPGASVYGWSEGLELLGHGRYDELAASTRQGALKLAARQMRATERPVGLLVWAGAHAWVMSGFKATADPALTDDFRVTHVWIEDPFTGRVSSVWGPGLEPHTLLSASELGDDYVRYASEYRPHYGRRGKFVIVAPIAETA